MATVHRNDITIGGQGSAVEFLIEMVSRKYEIKKQVIVEDADFEKSGSILNRVIERGRDGITVEADQRHVREMWKDLELERANHSATPCAAARKNEGNARSDESKGVTRCGRTDSDQARVGRHDGRTRPQMAGDDAADSQALIGGDITKYRALVARISLLSHDRPDLKFPSMQVCWAMAKPSLGSLEQSARSAAAEW